MGDEKTAFGAGSGVWTSVNVTDLLGCTSLQCVNVTLGSLPNKIQTANCRRVGGRPPL